MKADRSTSTRRLRLIRVGLVKPGRGKIPALLRKAPRGADSGAKVLEALLEARRGSGSER